MTCSNPAMPTPHVLTDENELRALADVLGVTHALVGDGVPFKSFFRSGHCDVCGRPAEAVYCYQDERLTPLPAAIVVDPEGMPPEICCSVCSLQRHGVSVDPASEVPN